MQARLSAFVWVNGGCFTTVSLQGCGVSEHYPIQCSFGTTFPFCTCDKRTYMRVVRHAVLCYEWGEGCGVWGGGCIPAQPCPSGHAMPWSWRG